jgi:hypothetical protein
MRMFRDPRAGRQVLALDVVEAGATQRTFEMFVFSSRPPEAKW